MARRYVPRCETVRMMEVSQPAEERIVDAVIDLAVGTFVLMVGVQFVKQLVGL